MLQTASYIAFLVLLCRAMPRAENNSRLLHNAGGERAEPLAFAPVPHCLHETGDSRG